MNGTLNEKKGIAITMPMDLPTNFLIGFRERNKNMLSPYVLGSPPKVTLPETKLGRAPEGKTHLPTNPSVFEVLSILVSGRVLNTPWSLAKDT